MEVFRTIVWHLRRNEDSVFFREDDEFYDVVMSEGLLLCWKSVAFHGYTDTTEFKNRQIGVEVEIYIILIQV